MDYGNSSPDSIVVSYKHKSTDLFFEVKRISGLERNNEWHPLLSWEEVIEINEVIKYFIILLLFSLIIITILTYYYSHLLAIKKEYIIRYK